MPSERAMAASTSSRRLRRTRGSQPPRRAEAAREAPAAGVSEARRAAGPSSPGRPRGRRGPALSITPGTENPSPTMIVTRGPRRARSAFTSGPPPNGAADDDPVRAGAGDAAGEGGVARGRRCRSSQSQRSRCRAAWPRGGTDGRAGPPEVSSPVEHVDAREPEPLGEQSQGTGRDVGPADDASVVARAGRVVDVRLAAIASARRSLGASGRGTCSTG